MKILSLTARLIIATLILTSILSFNGKKDTKKIDNDFVKISNSKEYQNTLCSKYEVSNSDYRFFLTYLRNNDPDLFNKCIYDSTKWTTFYEKANNIPMVENYHWHPAYDGYPIVNIDYNSALEYCKWLTKEYNLTENRTYKKVEFRLPTEEEWIIASKCLPDGRLPWYGDNGYNIHVKYMANIKFKIIDANGVWTDYLADNAMQTVLSGEFPVNSIGLCDIIGNVSEMISEEGKAKGGNWNSYISDCYIDKYQEYKVSNPEVGFRVFMEIIEE